VVLLVSKWTNQGEFLFQNMRNIKLWFFILMVHYFVLSVLKEVVMDNYIALVDLALMKKEESLFVILRIIASKFFLERCLQNVSVLEFF